MHIEFKLTNVSDLCKNPKISILLVLRQLTGLIVSYYPNMIVHVLGFFISQVLSIHKKLPDLEFYGINNHNSN